jgi:hypothetical protein
MFTQLDPTLPVHVVDRGDGYAFAVIDYGQEHNLIWVTALNASGEIWCAPNSQVRVLANWTMGRSKGAHGKAASSVSGNSVNGCAPGAAGPKV